MGRTFNSTNQNFGKASALVTTYPVSVAFWVYVTALPSTNAILWDLSDASDAYVVQVYLDSSGFMNVLEQNISGAVSSIPAITLNTWLHIGGVFASSSNRTIYVNGGNSANNTYAASGMAPTNTAWANQIVLGYNLSGNMSFPAVWKAALSAADFLALSKGISPKRYKPTNLICYLTDSQGASPVPDIASATPWTVNGSPPNAGTNPRIYGP